MEQFTSVAEPQLPSVSQHVVVKSDEYDDDDDAHTVVVEDSLSFNDPVKALTGDDENNSATAKS